MINLADQHAHLKAIVHSVEIEGFFRQLEFFVNLVDQERK